MNTGHNELKTAHIPKRWEVERTVNMNEEDDGEDLWMGREVDDKDEWIGWWRQWEAKRVETTVNHAEISRDRPRQPAYEIFSINRRFSQS